MYAAPRNIETQIFATLPEELRFRNRTSGLSKFVEGEFDSFLEGPSFDRLGNLYCVDLAFARIFCVDTNGKFHVVAEYDGAPNGLKIKGPNDLVFSPAGDLYFTDQGMSDLINATGRIFRLRADGRLDLLLDKLPSPYGITLDPSGRVLYVALTRANR